PNPRAKTPKPGNPKSQDPITSTRFFTTSPAWPSSQIAPEPSTKPDRQWSSKHDRQQVLSSLPATKNRRPRIPSQINNNVKQRTDWADRLFCLVGGPAVYVPCHRLVKRIMPKK